MTRLSSAPKLSSLEQLRNERADVQAQFEALDAEYDKAFEDCPIQVVNRYVDPIAAKIFPLLDRMNELDEEILQRKSFERQPQ